MQKNRIKYIRDDSEILSVGRLFRKIDGTMWHVNLQLHPHHERSYLSLSQAAILARHRQLNATNKYRKKGYRKSIKISDSRNWTVCKIGDCPAVNSVRLYQDGLAQKCFQFTSQDHTQIFLPQFELARVLFFHDAYLARTSMHPEVLQLEFSVVPDEEDDAVLVNVSEAANLPIDAFNSPDRRRQIGWVLLDDEARTSFESINRYQMLDGQNLGSYRRWNFQFDPPPLRDVWLETRGWFDQASKSMFINEIDAVADIGHNVPQKLEFYSPKFAEQVQKTGAGGTVPPPSPNDDDEIKDGEESASDTKTTLIEISPVKMSFLNPFETIKVHKKKRPSSGGRKDDDTQDPKDKGLSTEEGDETGEVPGADWEMTEDMSDDSHLYISKFEGFLQMLDVLEKNHNCQILSKQIRKLPKIGRCKKHLLTSDGSPRSMAVVVIRSNRYLIQMLEADTSDAVQPLSTLLLVFTESQKWLENISEIEIHFLKSSLCWPSELLNQLCHKAQYKRIPHPRREKAVPGLIDAEVISHWAERVYKNIVAISG